MDISNTLEYRVMQDKIKSLEKSLSIADAVAINAKILVERGGIKTVKKVKYYLNIWSKDWSNRI